MPEPPQSTCPPNAYYLMSNSPLPIQVTVSRSGAPMTANAGVVLVVQLLQQLGVLKETSPERSQG